MSSKSFSDAKKPQRRPTAEEIAAFEETGRALARERKITAKAERRESRKAETRASGNTESSLSVNKDSMKHGNEELQKHGDAASRDHGNTESKITEDGETQTTEATVRLTIDLPESVHTRFKAACASTRRKMVEEVRAFIEHRTAELESDFARRQ